MHSKQNYVSLKKVSYMFRLKYIAIIRSITKTKSNSHWHGCEIWNPCSCAFYL